MSTRQLKKIIVPKFIHNDDFGESIFSDVEIIFDPSVNEITPKTFNQGTSEYFLSDFEIQKMTRDSAQRFYNAIISDVLSGEHSLTAREIGGIRIFFNVNGAELGELIGLDKSSVSRILKGEGKQELQKDNAMLLMERFKSELDCAGNVKKILEHIHPKKVSGELVVKNYPAISVAEMIVRKLDAVDELITSLKLQKLLYYVQGIGFGRYHTKIIAEPFLRWEHGPVVKEVWNNYPRGKASLSVNGSVDLSSFEKDVFLNTVIDETLASYGQYSAGTLRNKTHNESPWLETRKDEVITDEKFLSFFKKAVV